MCGETEVRRGLFVRVWTEWRGASCVFLCGILVSLIFLILGAVEIGQKTSAMGQGGSTSSTALECLLNNFSDFQNRARGYGGAPPDPEVLRTFSELEWPTFDVGWPTEGTFDLPTLFAVRATVHRVPHPDQHLYVDIWVDIATERPGYIRKCMQGNREGRRSICLVAGKNQQRGKERPCDDLDPGQLQNKPRLVPVLPEQREDSLDPVNAPPPYYRREEPDFSRQGNGEAVSPPHTRGGAMYNGGGFPLAGSAAILPPKGDAAILPLREAPPAPDAPPPRLIYVPLSASDLYNWKHQNPHSQRNPKG